MGFIVLRVVFEAEASGGGGVRQVVSPILPFPPHFHSPYIISLPVGGKVRPSEGEVPRLPPTNKYHPDCTSGAHMHDIRT